jgi:hypothetical protein
VVSVVVFYSIVLYCILFHILLLKMLDLMATAAGENEVLPNLEEALGVRLEVVRQLPLNQWERLLEDLHIMLARLLTITKQPLFFQLDHLKTHFLQCHTGTVNDNYLFCCIV